MQCRAGTVLAISLIAAVAASGDEAIRRDGTRVAGTLSLAENGRFTFRGKEREEPVGELEFVRFPAKPPASSPVVLWHQVRFAHGEVLLAEVRKIEATHLHARPAWHDVLAIPLTAIERVAQAPGWRLVFLDTFDGDLGAWRTIGDPRTEDGRLALAAAGQAVDAKPKAPIAAGRVDVTFPSEVTKSRTLTLELVFEGGGAASSATVELIGPAESYAVTSPAKADHQGRLKRASGIRRLTAEFDRDRFQVFVDDLVLWSQRSGPGDLTSIRLVAGGTGSESASVDHVAVLRAESPGEPRPWADLTADAVRSPDGDETFGSLTAAGPSGVSLGFKGRKYTFPWPGVAEFAFRRGPVAEQSTSGEHVRVRVRSADGVRDIFDGAVKSFDDKALVLAHAVLGDLTIPRAQLEEVRLLFHGRRQPIDTSPRHLGLRPAFGFAVPKPEALFFRKTVHLETVPAAGFVVVDAAQVSGSGTPVEVLANGERIGDLNRLADRPEQSVRAFRLAVPAANWRRSENRFEVRVRPDNESKRLTGVDLRAVRLELHDPR